MFLMRVLMLGWEYPPHITGGLGNACRGLARALVRQGLTVRFVMPRPGAGSLKHDDGLDTVMIDPAVDPSEIHSAVSDQDSPHDANSSTVHDEARFKISHGTGGLTGDSGHWPGHGELRHSLGHEGAAHLNLSTQALTERNRVQQTVYESIFGAVEVWRLRVDAAWQSVYPGSRFMKPAADYDQPLRGLGPRTSVGPASGRSEVQQFIDSFFTDTAGAAAEGHDTQTSLDGNAGVKTRPGDIHAAPLETRLESIGPSASKSDEPNKPLGLIPGSAPYLSAEFSPDFDPDFDGTTTQVYPGDPVQGARAFADAVVERLVAEPFDLIHANDWVTFPAALALGKAWSVPVVLHVHSLESDRAAKSPNPAISQLESRSLKLADAVVAVSKHTRDKLVNDLAIEPDRAFVVYNGVEMQTVWQNLGLIHRDDDERIGTGVLFLGRVTAQKGPLQFLHACARVREKLPAAFFVMAGDGDLLPACRELARELGLADHIVFTGFLSPEQVKQTLQQADVLVVPSLSEPFGLVVLEAASQGVPAVVSEQAGVAEAMHHLIKCDPLNVEDIADKILGVLRYPMMREELRLGARAELLRLSWDAGARRCLDVYRAVL